MRLAAQQGDWTLGLLDETGGSRRAQPALHSWTAGEPRRLIEQPLPKGERDPKAVACDGRLRTAPHKVGLRFVDGRPVSPGTTAWLAGLCDRLAGARKRVLVLIGGKASWHRRQEVRHWIRTHPQQAKPAGAIRLLVSPCPVKSPWLNPLEPPRGRPSKRAMVEPARRLTAAKVISRVCDDFAVEHLGPLTQKVA